MPMCTRMSVQTQEQEQETPSQKEQETPSQKEQESGNGSGSGSEREREHEQAQAPALVPTQVQLQTPAPSFDLSDFPNHCRLDFEIIVKNADWGTAWTDCVRAAVDLQRGAGYPVSTAFNILQLTDMLAGSPT